MSMQALWVVLSMQDNVPPFAEEGAKLKPVSAGKAKSGLWESLRS
jgi:hypothetical protein